MPYRLSFGSARGALLETPAPVARTCDREAGRPLQSMRFCHSFRDRYGLLPNIPLAKVSPIESGQIVGNTHTEEKVGVCVSWGKLTVRLGIQEANLVQGHPDGL